MLTRKPFFNYKLASRLAEFFIYREPATRRQGEEMNTAGKCVLVVEDNLLNMKLFSAMLAAQGCQVLQAGDAPRALDLAHQQHPDLIIMDVNLPGMSGLQATHSLKADRDTSDIPVIVTTAYGLRGSEAELRASGCDGFMAKPIGISDFLELVATLLTRPSRPRLHAV
jgi:two-component system, cell cycle response regulator DivK